MILKPSSFLMGTSKYGAALQSDGRGRMPIYSSRAFRREADRNSDWNPATCWRSTAFFLLVSSPGIRPSITLDQRRI
jgi:hypothetical protein